MNLFTLVKHSCIKICVFFIFVLHSYGLHAQAGLHHAAPLGGLGLTPMHNQGLPKSQKDKILPQEDKILAIKQPFKIPKGLYESVGNNDGIDKLPRGQTVFVSEAGKSLTRVIQASDLIKAVSDLRFLMVYPGFTETAMLLGFDSAQKTVVSHCSAVLVGDTYALTAKHCIGDKSKPKLLLHSSNGKTVTESSILACIPIKGAIADECPYSVARLDSSTVYPTSTTQILMHPSKQSGTDDLKISAPDIALLTFKSINPQVVIRSANVVATESISVNRTDTNTWITVIGFGRSDIASRYAMSGGYWRPGDKQAPTPISQDMQILLHSDATTRLCERDSGGPVFLEPYNGQEPTTVKRKVGALVSQGWNINSVEGCKSSPAGVVQLITPTIKTWLCKESKLGIDGCK